MVTCPACRSQVEQARREEEEVFGHIAGLGHPVPPVTAASIRGLAQSARPTWFRWAAGIVATLGISTAAYAAPGSPLPAWFNQLLDRSEPAGESGPLPTPRPEGPGHGGGIAVAPGADFTLLFLSPERGGTITVSVEEGLMELIVEAEVGQATFTSEVGSLSVRAEGPSADFLVKIPQAAPSVSIQVDGRSVFSREDGETTTGVVQDDLGRWVIAIPAQRSYHPPGGPNGLGGQPSPTTL
jgi:hypothetical protein